MDGLLVRLTEAGLYARADADDELLLVTGRFMSVICDRMQMACKTVEKWCKEMCLSVNPAKIEPILFTRRKKIIATSHDVWKAPDSETRGEISGG